ncbi:MAG TPA: hypothetical protein VKH41_13420 [Myxococcota bacterium]|nr:hypothetical protein [Myxococcota bacterium]
MQLKPGTRIKSAVCATELMVIQAPAGDADVRCGGAPMLGIGDPKPDRAIDPSLKAGTQIGKRYVDAAGTIELLCTKPGEGTLALGNAPFVLKEAKPLPASD